MSLENAIQQNTDAIHALIEALTAAKPAAPVVAPIETKVVEPVVETAKVEEVTFDQVRQALLHVAKLKGRDTVIALLDTYGAQNLSDVAPADLPKLYADIKVAE